MGMNVLALEICIFIFTGISVSSMVRVIIGPTSEDRMIGLNLVSAQVTAILVLIAVEFNRSIYLDVDLVYAILGFIGMLAIARYLGREAEKK